MRFGLFIIGILLCPVSLFAGLVEISYKVEEISSGTNTWQYIYTVKNKGLEQGVHEFTIYFDFGLYDDLTIVSPTDISNAWDEIKWQPDPVIEGDGAYDALALNPGISFGQEVIGFAIQFTWLGDGYPEAQRYEIVSPFTFTTIESGYTVVPEPATLLFSLVGALIIRRKNYKQEA